MLTCDCESGRYLLPCMPPITTTSVIIEPNYITGVINRLIIKYISNSLVLHSCRLAYLESNDKLADLEQPSSHVDT